MTYTTYSATQAATRAKQYTSWRTGYCLNFVRNMLSPTVSSRFVLPDANSAWTYAQQKVTTGIPPAGAPVYWRSGIYGHIAISLGNGYCRSTDYPSKGRVGTVNIWYLTSLWGMGYRGWSRDYAGLTIRGLEAGGTSYSSTPTISTGGLSMSDVNDILAAISKLSAQVGEKVGYQEVGTTGKSQDTYTLATNNWAATAADRADKALARIAAVETKLDALIAKLG